MRGFSDKLREANFADFYGKKVARFLSLRVFYKNNSLKGCRKVHETPGLFSTFFLKNCTLTVRLSRIYV
ncbi:hypothetical protein A2V82_04885 [candidate division KSB1 bacterium RBG_16_48_16]|nr:MAG: hypothetical protein A2V82_04885 [candidate division KSB1 bacterium RBG_16_48_16]